VWVLGGFHPHTKALLPLQISELKNHGILQALTTETNGWEPSGKDPFCLFAFTFFFHIGSLAYFAQMGILLFPPPKELGLQAFTTMLSCARFYLSFFFFFCDTGLELRV
jgi:hypothetical protein